MSNISSKMISVTPKAIARLENLINNSKAKAIKIGVENGGCAGMAYTMDYVTDLRKWEFENKFMIKIL